MQTRSGRCIKIHVRHEQRGPILNRRVLLGAPVILDSDAREVGAIRVPDPDWPGRLEPIMFSVGRYVLIPGDGWRGKVTTGPRHARKTRQIPPSGSELRRIYMTPDMIVTCSWGSFTCVLQFVLPPRRRMVSHGAKTANFRGR